MKKIVMQFHSDNATEARYNEVWDDLRSAGFGKPKGLLYHVAAHNGNNLSITDVWESEEALQEFQKVLFPLMEKSGITGPPPTLMPVYYEYVGE